MSENYFGFYPAKILSYNREGRTCKVSIEPFTRGSDDGITAKLAYAVGDTDFDTEIQLLAGMEVWVFFEAGNLSNPVIAFCRSHGTGAEVGTRRIRQDKIELIATNSIKLIVGDKTLELDPVRLATNAFTLIDEGLKASQTISSDDDVTAGNISLTKHKTGGVRSGSDISGGPVP